MLTTFIVALRAVAMLLIIAIPGYLLMKRRMLSESCIPGFSKVLLFVCQPCLAVFSFRGVPRSGEMIMNIALFALLIIIIHALMLGASYFLLKKKYKNVIYRIITIGTTFGNCAFFGIPIIEALIPEAASGVIVYTTVYAVVMNVLGWTVGSAIISGDSKYISFKKIFLNPAMIGTLVAILIYLTGIDFPSDMDNMIEWTARMATPLSMIVMGMRLATVNFADMLRDKRIYVTVAVKHIVMPMLAFAIAIALTGINVDMRRTFFVLCACPMASIVLNFAEIVGEGQRDAANLVLVSTILSIVTLPFVMLLMPLIG
ncbi:MAG: hypothetical protein E7617_02375 [Ruminococcaceae bacterium]|nr:hypothetical protein [Oscillospiraceae bacterium]